MAIASEVQPVAGAAPEADWVARGDIEADAQAAMLAASRQFITRYFDAVLIAAAAAWVMYFWTHWTNPIAVVAFSIAAGFGKLFVRQQRWERARDLMVMAPMAVAIVVPFTVAGIRTPVLVMWPLVIVLAAWQYHRWAALKVTLFAVAHVTLLWIFDATGVHWLESERGASAWWLVYMLVLALTGLAVWFFVGQFQFAKQKELEIRQKLLSMNRSLQCRLNSLTEELANATQQLDDMQHEVNKYYGKATMAEIVPGLAHDLVTPISNAGMATSTLHDSVSRFDALLAHADVRKSDLSALLHTLRNGLQVIDRATARASSLVGSLKSLSIDQAADRRRQFDLSEILRDTLTLLAPTIKKRAARIEVSGPTGIYLDSYPGALSQVLLNLVQNSVLHGFDDGRPGAIAIKVRYEGDSAIAIEVADNGVGIPEAIRAKVFDPFFTTKAGKGGSGVGLAVSREFVETHLGGSLDLESDTGCGTCITIRMPRSAPERNSSRPAPR